MVDQISKKHRSWNMSRIKSRDTKPEKIVRSLLHRLGYRFRIYRKDLPGKPDIVLPKYHIAILVHGCFWHQHEGCSRCTKPSTNQEYWTSKFTRNKQRDREVVAELEKLGWKVMVIWECETKKNKMKLLESKILKVLYKEKH